MTANTLKSLKPDELGLDEGFTGHRLLDAVEVPQTYYAYYTFTCSCGWTTNTTATMQGKPSAYFTKAWRNHLEVHSTDPDEETILGKVMKPRTTWTVKVITQNHQHANAYAQTKGWWNGWGDPASPQNWDGYPWAVVVDRVSPRGKTSRAIKTISSNRTDAVRKGLHLIDMEAQRGSDVEYEDQYGGTGTVVVAPTLRNTFTELVTRIDTVLDGGQILDVELTIQEIDEVLGLVPVLQARRDELAKVYDDRTVGLLKQ